MAAIAESREEWQAGMMPRGRGVVVVEGEVWRSSGEEGWWVDGVEGEERGSSDCCCWRAERGLVYLP